MYDSSLLAVFQYWEFVKWKKLKEINSSWLDILNVWINTQLNVLQIKLFTLNFVVLTQRQGKLYSMIFIFSWAGKEITFVL